MVSIRNCLPPDMAPVVILDASGRIRTAYQWWQQHRETLVRLAEAPKRYDNLAVHVWDIGGGKASFAHEQDLHHRCSGITEPATGDAELDEPEGGLWLLVDGQGRRSSVRTPLLPPLL
jgi:hypothetical protein